MASIRRLSEGRYQITWLEGYVVGPDGKRRQRKRSEIVRGTRRDAERRAAEIDASRVPASKLRDPHERTFGRVAAEWLKRRLEDVERGELARGTWRRYDETMRRYALPLLEAVPLAKLEPADVERAYAAAPPGAARQLHAAMRQVLRWAMRQRWIGWDVAVMVKPPVRRTHKRSPVPLPHVALILQAFQETPHFPLVVLACTTGLRISELLGLRWSDVDWEGQALRVAQALKEAGARPAFGAPKGKEPFPVAIEPWVLDILRQHRAAQEADKRRWTEDWGLIFAASDGSPISEGNWLKRVWHAVLTTLLKPGQTIVVPTKPEPRQHVARTGDSLRRLAWHYGVSMADLRRSNQDASLLPLPRYVPHQLRHTFATYALGGDDPMPVTAVAKAGGWADATTVLRHYADAVTPDQRRVARKVGRLVRALVRAPEAAPSSEALS